MEQLRYTGICDSIKGEIGRMVVHNTAAIPKLPSPSLPFRHAQTKRKTPASVHIYLPSMDKEGIKVCQQMETGERRVNHCFPKRTGAPMAIDI